MPPAIQNRKLLENLRQAAAAVAGPPTHYLSQLCRAICDDNPPESDNISLSLKDLMMTVNLSSRIERFKQGKALRHKTPREAHADLKGSMSRDAVAILAESDPDRVPELVPERYARMTLNPFAFLRGAAAVMATDLAAQPMAGIPVQAGGDSHLMNFGAFVTPEDNILFDVNDFDETLPGVDFTVDLKRLAASVVVAALGAESPKKQARALAAETVKAYRTRM